MTNKTFNYVLDQRLYKDQVVQQKCVAPRNNRGKGRVCDRESLLERLFEIDISGKGPIRKRPPVTWLYFQVTLLSCSSLEMN